MIFLIASLIAVFLIVRPSKVMRKTISKLMEESKIGALICVFWLLKPFKEKRKDLLVLMLELKFQSIGIIGYFEDILSSFKNKNGEKLQ